MRLHISRRGARNAGSRPCCKVSTLTLNLRWAGGNTGMLRRVSQSVLRRDRFEFLPQSNLLCTRMLDRGMHDMAVSEDQLVEAAYTSCNIFLQYKLGTRGIYQDDAVHDASCK